MRVALSLLAAVGLTFATSGSASAQLVPSSVNCSYVFSMNIVSQFVPGLQDCAGAYIGDDRNYETEIAAEIANRGWGQGSYMGSTNAGSSSGPFSYVGNGPIGLLLFDSPLTGDYVFALQSANQFSLYYFTGLTNVSGGLYTTAGTSVNSWGWPNNLAHASLWSVSSASPGPVPVPEPASGCLLAATAVLMMVGAVRRRRSDEEA